MRKVKKKPPGHRSNIVSCSIPENMWLCCDQFTIADLSLAMLLNRLYCLGFEQYLWSSHRPKVLAYFGRVSERESFRKSLSANGSQLQTMWSKVSSAQLVGVATAVSAAVLLVSNFVGVK